MKNDEKDFDAVAMKRRAARVIHERLKDLSREERREYWVDRTEELRRKQADQQAASET
jgi:hypothetical protein